MSPATARSLGWLIYCFIAVWAWRTFWPESWASFSKIISACMPLLWWGLGGIFGATFIETYLLEWFGKRNKKGKLERYEDPNQARLERIDNAIHNLYGYVQELDPELAEERTLEKDFYSDAHMFAGMNLMEHVRERRKQGKRTLNDGFIYKTAREFLDEMDEDCQ
jgi:hypothetical protein